MTTATFCGCWLPAFSPKHRRRNQVIRARGVVARQKLRAVLRPQILEGCRARGWRNHRSLWEALDVILAGSALWGEHEGVPLAPAFEMTHPLALALLDKRAPTGLPKRIQSTDPKERSQFRNADRDWRERVGRLAELGVVNYMPGRGLTGGKKCERVANAAPIPSVYAVPLIWERIKDAGKAWIARALDSWRRFIPHSHWKRRHYLWEMLTGEPPPEGSFARRRALDEWLGPVGSVAPRSAELTRSIEKTKAEPPPRPLADPEGEQGWALVWDTWEGRADGPGPAAAGELEVSSEFPGVVSVRASRGAEGPLLGGVRTTFFTPESERQQEDDPAGLLPLAPLARGGLHETLAATVGRMQARGAERRSELFRCDRCEDSGTLARVAATLAPKPCPDCGPLALAAIEALVFNRDPGTS